MTRIGILQADSVREEFQDAFGSYPGMFRSLLSRAAADASVPVDFAVFDVEHGEYPAGIDACDGYVITGSRESVYADLPWIATLSDYVRSLHAARKKTVGVCFGHQLVAQALGGQTRPADVGWGVGVHRLRILAEERWMQPPLPAVSLLSSHKDQVVKMPPGARLLGSNDFCPIGAFALGDHFLTFQGHPEFEKGYARALMGFREALLGDAYAPGIASLSRPTDDAAVGRWMLRFLAGEAVSGSAARAR